MQVHGLAVEGKRHVCGTASPESAAVMRFQRRMSPSCVQLTYMFDGDHHGVVYYLGSKNGQQAFVNPALSGQMQVSNEAAIPMAVRTSPYFACLAPNSA